MLICEWLSALVIIEGDENLIDFDACTFGMKPLEQSVCKYEKNNMYRYRTQTLLQPLCALLWRIEIRAWEQGRHVPWMTERKKIKNKTRFV